MGGWKLQPGYVIYCGALFSLVNSRGAIKIHQATAHVYYKNNSKRREKASEIRLAGRCLKTQAASSGAAMRAQRLVDDDDDDEEEDDDEEASRRRFWSL